MNVPPDPRPRPPEQPLPTDCCGGGCAVCVNDVYQEELDDYRARLAEWMQQHPEPDAADASASHRP
ncbi:oxidoreductase-like domain-containing protein [Lysobacter xanthus]